MSWFIRKGSKAAARKAPQRVRLQLEVLEDRLVPTTTTYTVAAGDVATLINDIKAANAASASDPSASAVINLTAGTYDFTAAADNNFGPNALPTITGNITIDGHGAVLMRDPSLVENGTPLRFFYVSGSQVVSPSGTQSTGAATGSLTLENLTLEDGLAQGGSSGTGGGGLGAGGAILNMGNLTVNGVTLEQNIAQGGSSGLGTSTTGGNMGGSSSTPDNFGTGGTGSSSGTGGFGGGGGSTSGAGGFGAGAGTSNAGGGGLGAGGAIFNMYGNVNLTNSTLASNLAEGGQAASGGNSGDGYGGAIFNVDGTVTVMTSTLAGNSTIGALNGGGAIYNLNMGANSTITLTDSILADSIGSNDLVNDQNNSSTGSATVNATAPNIVMSMSNINGNSYGGTISGTPITANPQLGLLTNNGGLTPTMALLAGSPALGAGTAGSNVPTTDQRGVARGSVLDLGAYQSTPASAVATTLTLTSSTPAASSGSSVTLTATVTPASGSTTPAGTVVFVDVANHNTVLGSASVGSNGVATLTTSSVSSGDTITASYSSSNGMGNSSGSTTVPAASTSSSSSGNTSGTTSPPPVPISTQNQQWLEAVYKTLLHRDIDTQGLNQWGAALNNGTTATQVVLGIEQTTEYETDEVQAAFQQYLGAAAPSTAVTYLVGLMQGGADFRVILSIIVGSPAFYAEHGGTNQGFLNAVYEDFLNRAPDQQSETAWSNLMTAGYSPTAVVLGILSSPEYLNDLVTQDYMTYMGVAPDATSLGAYVAALQNGTMNENMVVASLLGSPEWITKSSATSASIA